MSLVFVILCWFSLGISALYWLRFDVVTMWICRPHYWWETRVVALCMTLSLLVLTLCATACLVKHLVERKRAFAEEATGFADAAESKSECI